MGVAGDLCVARRRRCPDIAFSLLLDLASQDPLANVTISMKRGTHVLKSTFAGADLWRVPLVRQSEPQALACGPVG